METQETVVVVFRKFKEGDVLALFPFLDEGNGRCTSYQHVGQHGAADYNHGIAITSPASPEEYATLEKELEHIGYILSVKKRSARKRR